MAHLETELLSAYIDAELSPGDMAQVEAHLAACQECRRAYDDVLGMATLVRELPVYVPRQRVVIEPDERNRDAGLVPTVLEFARPVALAAVIILIALAGLRLVSTDDDPDDAGQIPFTERRELVDGTDPADEASQSVPVPEGAAPDMAEAPPDSEELPAEEEVQETDEINQRAAPEEAPRTPSDGTGFGMVEALVAGTVVVVALAAAWRVRNRVSHRRQDRASSSARD
jgi:negative regulator of sigma E activity